MNKNSFSAVIFDMDGVLWRSSLAHERAFKMLFADFQPADFCYLTYAGMRTDDVIRDYLADKKENLSNELVKNLTKKKRELAFFELKSNPPITESCYETLSTLSKDYQLGLGSSSSKRNINLFLESSGTRKFFSAIVCGDEVDRAKPEPDIYNSVLRRLGVNAEQAIVLEDAKSGVQASVSAGIHTLGFAGTTEEDTLIKAGAKRVIYKLEDLVKEL